MMKFLAEDHFLSRPACRRACMHCFPWRARAMSSEKGGGENLVTFCHILVSTLWLSSPIKLIREFTWVGSQLRPPNIADTGFLDPLPCMHIVTQRPRFIFLEPGFSECIRIQLTSWMASLTKHHLCALNSYLQQDTRTWSLSGIELPLSGT